MAGGQQIYQIYLKFIGTGLFFFFTISLYLAKYKNNSKFFLKISHFLFFHRRKIYQGEVIYKIYEKRYFFFEKEIALEAFISYEQMCNNHVC